MATKTVAEVESRAGPRKRDQVASLTEKLSRATSAVVADYRGLTVKQIEELRTILRKDGIEFVVDKHTLARRAADAAGVGVFSEALTGPVGLAVGYDDVSRPAKLLNDYFKTNKRLPLMAGFVEGRVLTAAEITTVADLPPREALLAQLAGTLLSPLTTLAASLNSPLSSLAATLDAYRDQLEKAA